LAARPWRALDALSWTFEARRVVAGLAVDSVVAHWSVPCGWPVAVAAPDADLALVSHGGDVRLLAAMPEMLRGPLVERLARRARSWTFVSRALLDTLARALDGATRAHLERIARVEAAPIELPDVRAAIGRCRAALGGARVAVCVARLVRGKRLDRAIEHVARARDFDALVVVGDGPERNRLERLARERGLNARFVGQVSRHEALGWIGAADALLHTSEAEGLSTVVREADALGTPVIRIGGRAENE
jgi:glycosyltransferase involved in cell wall biosynthesis